MSIQRRNSETMGRLVKSLKRKELQAVRAKNRGMHSTYGNLMSEITELKRKVRKCQMGS